VAAEVEAALREVADPASAPPKAAYLQAGPGGYAEGDRFLGATVPQGRQVARRFWREATDTDLVLLLGSPWHEVRHAALRMVCEGFTRGDDGRRTALVQLVLDHRERIDNWDLVDAWTPYVLGPWALEHGRRGAATLDRLMASTSLWDRRSALVATLAHVRAGEQASVVRLALRAVDDDADLVHKAAGWVLREMGNRDRTALLEVLDQHAGRMPRVMLRYAVEKLDPQVRRHYRGLPRLA